MGYHATTTGGDDLAPVEDFSMPPDEAAPRERIAGRITGADGTPLADAKVALGPLVAEAGADGRYSLDAVAARTYANLIITAPGYDRSLAPVTVLAAQTTTLDRALRRNWAAQPGGATVSGGDEHAAEGCGAPAAVDQRQGIAWSMDGPGPKSTTIALPVPAVKAAPAPPAVGKPSFTLAGSGKRSIRVSARCPKACAITGTLTVDAKTARTLHSRRTLASIKRTLKAGSTTFAVKVSKRFTTITRIEATLTVRSGSVVQHRRVTIRR